MTKDDTATLEAPTGQDIATRALVVLIGLATVYLSLVALPFGIVLVAADLALAFASRGAYRRIFLGFAIVGALTCLTVGLTLVAVSGTSELGTLTES